MADEWRKKAKVLEDEAFALLRKVTALEAERDRLREALRATVLTGNIRIARDALLEGRKDG